MSPSRMAMRLIVIAGVLFGAAGAGVWFAGCGERGGGADVPVPAARLVTQPLPDFDPELARKLVADGALLLDVRSQDEYAERHLEGAKLIPAEDLADRLEEVTALTGGNLDRPIVVYCRSGRRAAAAKVTLLAAGYSAVTNLGGLQDWESGAAVPSP
ncbi:MAG: rhodanese-like domain-containing protein [Candidatus Schekmanbacteria bacterium]|nr:rhodanese-like domain-containing protein [Candidatus Schekmanbacteria bacterium]